MAGWARDFANPNGNPVLHVQRQLRDLLGAGAAETGRSTTTNGKRLSRTSCRQSARKAARSATCTRSTPSTRTSPTSLPPTSRPSGAPTRTRHPLPVGRSADLARAPADVTCLTDTQLRNSSKSFVAEHDLPKGMGTVYYVLHASGRDGLPGRGRDALLGLFSDHAEETQSPSYADSFCSYHSTINPDDTPSGDANTDPLCGDPVDRGRARQPWCDARTTAAATTARTAASTPRANRPSRRSRRTKQTEVKKKPSQKADSEEKAKTEETERLEAPHQEEPNQTSGTGDDGANDAGLADLIINQIAIEQQNIVTDPLLNAWQGQEAAGKDLESTDECRNFFAGGALGGSVTASDRNRGRDALEPGDRRRLLLPQRSPSTSPASKLGGVPCVGGVTSRPVHRAQSGERRAKSSASTGWSPTSASTRASTSPRAARRQENYATFSWNFGDGTSEVNGYAPGAPTCEAPWLSPCAASAFHTYQYGGTYKVTLTVTDVGGNTASVTHVSHRERTSTAVHGTGARARAGRPSRADCAERWQAPRRRAPAPARVPAPIATALIVPQTLQTRPAQGTGRQLLGQRAGRRALRGPAQPRARTPSGHRRRCGRRPARRLARGARDRKSHPGDDQGRAQRAAHPVLQEHGRPSRRACTRSR